MSKPFLEVHTPDGRRQIPGGDEPLTIGRHPQNAVVISDPVSSRRHCVIEKTPNGWRVRDLNSSNGTRLNGLVIEQSRLLPGDIVTIGGTRIVLVVPSAKPPKAARPREDTIQGAEPIPFDDGPDLAALEELEPGVAEVSEDDILDDADMITEDDLVEVADDDNGPLRIERDDDDNNPALSISQSSDDTWEA